jgi:hypothetical protein
MFMVSILQLAQQPVRCSLIRSYCNPPESQGSRLSPTIFVVSFVSSFGIPISASTVTLLLVGQPSGF